MTDRHRDRETKTNRDTETQRQRDREKERQRYRETFKTTYLIWWCSSSFITVVDVGYIDRET